VTTPATRRRRMVGCRAQITFAALACGFICAAAPPAPASPITGILDYQGYAYESLSFGTVGSILTGVGKVDGWFLPIENPNEFYTWRMTGLVCQGAVPAGDGVSYAQYSGGTFSVFQDLLDNAVYDATPGNGVADPSGFDDGVPWLVGDFASFEYYWDASLGLGAYSGDIFITGGTGAAYFPEVAFTFGGTTDRSCLPEGYGVNVDGQVEGPVVPEPSSALLLAPPLAIWLGTRIRRRRRTR
jgi:hypothetical protein